jgi:uncharacterized protein (TIGR01777 family)
MNIVIPGGTGFVGASLCRHLLRGSHQVTSVGRRGHHPCDGWPGFRHVPADTTVDGAWQRAVAESDAVVNLAGSGIFRRWSSGHKRRMRHSRLATTRHVVTALPADRPVALFSASGMGYYGDRGEEPLTEQAAAGGDFLAQLAADWEAEALAAAGRGARVTVGRLGVVLDSQGGAMKKMLPAFRLGLGGPIGSGAQWFPWIHLEDLLAVIEFALTHGATGGPVNVCAPGVLRQAEFARRLGRHLRRPAVLPVPALLLRLLLGEVSQMLLGSQRGIPARLESFGFHFRHPDIDSAFQAILSA